MKRIGVPLVLCLIIWITAVLYGLIYIKAVLDTIVFISLVTIQLVASINDLYSKAIPLKLIFIGIFMGYAVFLWFSHGDAIWNHVLGGAAAFLVMALFIMLSKGQIGGGDLWLMTLTGFFTGINSFLSILFISIILAGIYSIMLLLAKKANRRTEIPFAPFIMIATVILMLNN
ncbi:prepilin peptidase [Ruminiclostridium herbifermentans]|uniref:Prepilin peptidase n=1 Tax=Ruminiclostridium herbifermentans TaxID=2488810 RepID=A0A7H1VJX5_9FIRM|nr:A24 family peptidase [Ruminiclostridium herbifermentans]QNU65687.1 prepilin peptidase [Ruminiclostridium herbifermentans]